MADEPTEKQAPKSLRDRAADWVFSQSVPTVLSLLILAGLYRFVFETAPAGLEKIQQGYDKAEASHIQERKEVEERHTAQWAKVNQDFISALKDVKRGQVGSQPDGE